MKEKASPGRGVLILGVCHEALDRLDELALRLVVEDVRHVLWRERERGVGGGWVAEWGGQRVSSLRVCATSCGESEGGRTVDRKAARGRREW